MLRGDDKALLLHPALTGRQIDVHVPDLLDLESKGLLRVTREGRYGPEQFDVTPEGVAYYAWAQRRAGKPVERVEAQVKRYLASDEFKKEYPAAYDKWLRAEVKLWGSDSEQQLTEIGHLCREAMQEFATTLVERFEPRSVDTDKAHCVARVKAVLDLRANQLGNTEKRFLDGLLEYWGTVSDLVQRQEHGAQREGESLAWEDGRRVVFQLMVVMYEIDKAVWRIPA